MRRTLTLTTCAGLLMLGLAACNPTVTATGSSNDGATSGPSTHSVVGSNAGASGSAPTKAAAPAGPLLKLSGNGMKNTPKFTTGDSWTINYTYDCTGFLGGTGNFQVYVDYPDGDVAVNEMGAKGSSSSTESGAGTHTLKVASECPWTITITNS